MVLNRLGEEEQHRIRDNITEQQLDTFDASGQIELPAMSLVASAS
jgi:hypothetical protein